ncbi:ketoacyl-ACP synthase III family protein [Longispora urticae]
MTTATGIAGCAVHLPPRRQTARSAQLAPRDAATCEFEGYGQVAVGSGCPVETLAVPAAADALRQAGCLATDLDLVLYSWIHEQGAENPMPHARLARLLGAHNAVALGVQQMSNGGAAALEIADAMLKAGRARRALVVTSDIFDDDPQARWLKHGLRGSLPGDGATAVLIDTTPRPLALAAIASAGRPGVELQFFADFAPMHPLRPRPESRSLNPAAVPIMQECVRNAVDRVLAAEAIAPDDPRIRFVTFSRLGRTLLRRIFLPGLPPGLPNPLPLAVDTGHLGAGDLIADLAHVRNGHLLSAGEYALSVSIGMGFTATAALLLAN